MIVLTLDNFINYYSALDGDTLPREITDVYECLVEYIENEPNPQPDDDINESLDILSSFLYSYLEQNDLTIIEEPFPGTDQPDTNPLVNRMVTPSSNNQNTKSETVSESQIISDYCLDGDHRLQDKLKIINLLHDSSVLGFPVKRNEIKNRFGNAESNGINELVRYIKSKVETSYSDSTIRNLLQTVISVDGSKSL